MQTRIIEVTVGRSLWSVFRVGRFDEELAQDLFGKYRPRDTGHNTNRVGDHLWRTTPGTLLTLAEARQWLGDPSIPSRG